MKKPLVQLGPDFVRIVAGDKELVRWHEQDWKKNPALVYKIVEAVTVAAFEPELLEAVLERMRGSGT